MGKERTDTDIVVALNLRRLRQLAGITQTSLAEAIGVTSQQVHKYENGESRIAAGKLPALTKALGCTLDQIFDGLETVATGLARRSFLATKLAADFDNILSDTQREAVARIVSALAVDPARLLSRDDADRPTSRGLSGRS